MKKTLILLAMAFGLGCAAPAFGQGVQRGTVKVPFAFEIGTTMLPAGTYTIFTQSESHSILIRSVGVSAQFGERNIVLSSPAPGTKFVFRQDGDRHVLHQVLLMGDDHTHDLVHGPEILEIAQAAH